MCVVCVVGLLRLSAPSRRDDMESLGYCILSLYPHYTLPWAHLKSSGTQRADATRAIMMETTIADLCSNIPSKLPCVMSVAPFSHTCDLCLLTDLA